jgi:hypothetical protein
MSLQLAVKFFGASWSGQIVYVYGSFAMVFIAVHPHGFLG